MKSRKRTHCFKGHLFTPETEYVSPGGVRCCRICKAARPRSPHYRTPFDCPICGAPFLSNGGAKSRRTCSAACGNELRRQKLSKGRDASKQAARGRARNVIEVNRCDRCGTAGDVENRLEVHHRDRDPYNNAPTNLEVVCRHCHIAEHRDDRASACKNGHVRTPENTYFVRPGRPSCKICRAAGTARFHARWGRKKPRIAQGIAFEHGGLLVPLPVDARRSA